VTGTALWATVLIGSLGCYLLKLSGLSVPAAWVEQPWVARVVDFVPAALLAALVAVGIMLAVASGTPVFWLSGTGTHDSLLDVVVARLEGA